MQVRISQYRIMWVFVLFDLPTVLQKERKAYTKFRKFLLKDGFMMHQYSIYIRNCASMESAEAHIKRVENNLPEFGKVTIITLTDKQFGMMKNFYGVERKKPPNKIGQVEMF